MILCDFCSKEIAPVDEHDLVLWTVFRRAGCKVRLMMEVIPRPAKPPLRHICPGCKFKILDRLVRNPQDCPPPIYPAPTGAKP